MKTIEDIEKQLEKKVFGALKELDLLPAGYQPEVRLHGKSKDKKRTASFEKNWHPDTDCINIRFQGTPEQPRVDTHPEERGTEIRRYPREGPEQGVPADPTSPGAATASPNDSATPGPFVTDRLCDLIRALDRAESRPGYEFVALKWFRDTALPAEGFSWASDASTKQAILRDAIDRRLILTSRMPNPRSPQFPVTAIRLNRLMPGVKATLGGADDGASGFQPVPIRGENLSVTVLRDRR
ncbi:MAG TPA: hypothetical protein VGX94_09355 [Terriglobia bacterium]|nr:hypothetical protein [Terriglobia bacterium]